MKKKKNIRRFVAFRHVRLRCCFAVYNTLCAFISWLWSSSCIYIGSLHQYHRWHWKQLLLVLWMMHQAKWLMMNDDYMYSFPSNTCTHIKESHKIIDDQTRPNLSVPQELTYTLYCFSIDVRSNFHTIWKLYERFCIDSAYSKARARNHCACRICFRSKNNIMTSMTTSNNNTNTCVIVNVAAIWSDIKLIEFCTSHTL